MPEKITEKILKVIIAGGGTGGHLYPGIALADHFRETGAQVHFVGTHRGIESKVIPSENYPLHFIPVRGLKGGRIWATLAGLFILPAAFFRSIGILRKIKPDIVVGVGGYASGPLVFTAALLRYKSFILEQNTHPGITNRILGKVVRKIYASFPESKNYFPEKKFIYSGNPVRKKIIENIESGQSEESSSKVHMLIFGGSQGAHAINAAMAEVAPLLDDLSLEVKHQTGPKDQQSVENAWKKSGLNFESSEFIYDMHNAYKWADIIICRAGATTLAELAIAGKSAILIPFPYATDNHQELNARSCEKAGGAFCITEKELTTEILAEKIRMLVNDSELRKKMAEDMKTLAKKDAPQMIREDMLKILAK
ncbi:MAG: undecaprenyldiphospho-muramoylpentapeptide beta-N-acetylglucosaminyltransferase [Deltaproteobacteria bacterium]|nr:undecaprenyldiphospho-muramoylpentapeptide beta-N-acetylglucosaminyltransferase [Deltaproteobacteria bacterium]